MNETKTEILICAVFKFFKNLFLISSHQIKLAVHLLFLCLYKENLLIFCCFHQSFFNYYYYFIYDFK